MVWRIKDTVIKDVSKSKKCYVNGDLKNRVYKNENYSDHSTNKNGLYK